MESQAHEPHHPRRRAGVGRIAIVGRPNVGKSTLFNRFVGRRRAITDPTPGVTRDPIEAAVTILGRPVVVVDTGGYTSDRDEMARLISERALSVVERADVVLLLVDVTGLTSFDREFLDILAPVRDRLILVVNKVDGSERESLVWDFYELGIEQVVPVSSAHGLGMRELERAILDKLDPALVERTSNDGALDDADLDDTVGGADRHERADVPGDGVDDLHDESRPTRIAVLGRPNTGKSTLVNRLTGVEGSMVSSIPGTTRDVIEGTFSWKERDYLILDTAGIRRKSRVSENIEYYSVTRAIDTIERADVVVLMIDATEGLSDQDKKIAALVVDRGRGLVLGLNKWDLLPNTPNQFNAVRDKVHFQFPVLTFAPILALSAQTGSGIDELMREIGHVRMQLHHRVDTGLLNRHLKTWLERTPPPVIGRRGRPKMRYMTQVARLPITFVAFVNRKKDFADSYVGYLKNQVRSDFGLTKIPFRLELRER